jgi:hypothetical protein
MEDHHRNTTKDTNKEINKDMNKDMNQEVSLTLNALLYYDARYYYCCYCY